MVVKNVRDVDINPKIMESRSLKFGMDRILSEDATSRNGRSRELCDSVPPCAACITSLYRCCRSAPVFVCKSENRPSLPLRLYSNVLNPAESEAPENLQRSNSAGHVSKRKKSWSRAVFSNLQRKGLEKRFQLQKYITKPDRRQLAATLGLTDAQVKVWFQNRRMKWRHARDSAQATSSVGGSSENVLPVPGSSPARKADSDSETDVDVDVQTIDD